MDSQTTSSPPTAPPTPVTWLERFERLMASHPGAVPYSVTFEGTPTPEAGHIVIGSCIHGVETGSLPAIVQLLEQISEGRLSFAGRLSVFVGNPEAVRQGVRFVEADLNRVFVEAASLTARTLESERAAHLKPLLDAATLFVDFHQTMQPSATPFFIFGYHEESYLWARLMGGSGVLVTRDGRKAFSAGSLCGDEYCRKRGTPALTLELGEKGLRPEAERLTYASVRALLDWNAVVAHGRKRGTPTLSSLAGQRPEFTFYETVHREPFTQPRAALRPGLHNFTKVTAGEVLGHSQGYENGEPRGTAVCAPCEGIVLFPKYPRRDSKGDCLDPVAGELFHLAVPLASHPRDLWG